MIAEPELWGYCELCGRWFYIERHWSDRVMGPGLACCPVCESMARRLESRPTGADVLPAKNSSAAAADPRR